MSMSFDANSKSYGEIEKVRAVYRENMARRCAAAL